MLYAIVLIESDWNLKSLSYWLLAISNSGINRIRLEFKGNCLTMSPRSSFVLIESDWNLKHNLTPEQKKIFDVLIESDWNLKKISLTVFLAADSVLIESDWNLK